MKDVFYTILVVWIVWRILNSVNTIRAKQTNQSQGSPRRAGETTVNYAPAKKKTVTDVDGEYVEFEEVK